MNGWTFEKHTTLESVKALEDAWNELHQHAAYASTYNGFDFIYRSLSHFSQPDIELYIVAGYQKGVLQAIFPMQISIYSLYGFKYRVLAYAAQWEIDKPYPLLREDTEEHAWQAFAQFLKQQRRDWHQIHLMEIPEGMTGIQPLNDVMTRPGYFFQIRPDRKSPLVNLRADWEERWSSHRKMRKKVNKMQKDLGDDFRFQVISDGTDWETWLAAYVDIESRGWKAGKVGIGKNEKTLAFYRDLFSDLAHRNALVFGVLFCGDKPVSIEIAYLEGSKVYFSHGTFDESFAKYSPGMVSTCLLLEYFHCGRYTSGDYLAGYASYIVPWADKLQASQKVFVYRLSATTLYVIALKLLRKVVRRIKPAKDDVTGIRKATI